MQINNRIRLAIFFLIFSIFIFSDLVSANTLVEPGRFIFPIGPGAKVSDAIKVTNTGDEEIEIRAILYDWMLDDDDQLITFDKNTRQDTLHGLIKFNPRQFKLAPGDTQFVRFTITTPQNGFDFERRGIVFFEQENSYEQKGVGATVITQIGTTIYATPTTADFSFRLAKAVAHIPEEGDSLGILLLKNEGVSHIRYRTMYKIIDEKGEICDEGKIPEKIILPKAERIISFPLPSNLLEGKYNLLLEIGFYGTDKKIVHAVPFEVKY